MKPFAMFGAFVAHKGKEEELLSILNNSEHSMDQFPGCITYNVYRDPQQKEKIWVFEEWNSEEDHKNSLQDPFIKKEIEKAMPLIESFAESFKLIPANSY